MFPTTRHYRFWARLRRRPLRTPALAAKEQAHGPGGKFPLAMVPDFSRSTKWRVVFQKALHKETLFVLVNEKK